METLVHESLATMLSASLSTSGLKPIIDVQQTAVLLACSEGHIQRLAESGQLPGTKYGRGWIFVTAQLLHHVVAKCAGNLRAVEASSDGATLATDPPPAERKQLAAPPPLALTPFEPPKRRGRPRRGCGAA
jgi:excisionase family DNA binding protein